MQKSNSHQQLRHRAYARRIWTGFSVGLVVVSAVGLISIRAINDLIEANHRVTHTHKVIESLEGVREASCLGDSNARGFAITGNDSYRREALAALAQSQRRLADADGLTIDNQPQQSRLALARNAWNERYNFTNSLLERRERDGAVAALQMISTGDGQRLSDALDEHLNAAIATEYELLRMRVAAAQSAGARSLQIIAAGLIVTLICAAFAGWNARRALGALETQTIELIESEQQVYGQSQLLRSVFEGMSDAVIAYDRQGRVMMRNTAADSIRSKHQWSLRIDEIVSRQRFFDECGQPLERDSLPAIAALSGRTVDKLLYRVERQDDANPLWLEASARPLYNERSTITGAVVVARDVSRRRQAEQMQAHLAEIIRCSSDAIESVTFDGVVMTWNPAAEALYGYSSEEMIGRSLAIIEPPQREGELLERFGRFVSDQSPQRFETLRRRKDGSIIEVALTLSAMRDGRGRAIGVSAIARDVTEYRRVMRDLASRTRELERSNEDLSYFAYSASHDLQEPLRMVTGFMQLLRDRYRGRLDSNADEFIDFAIEGATRMKQLIDGVLRYSRAGREAALAPLDAAEPLNFAVANLHRLINDAGAAITVEPMPLVIGDPHQLAELFQNLIGNAIKFRSTRPCTVKVTAQKKADQWEFIIADNGLGIDPAHRERIFQMFQRLHTRAEYEGTGIGLAICRKIVERHGGQIWVEPAAEQGAAFHFTLPAASVPTVTRSELADDHQERGPGERIAG